MTAIPENTVTTDDLVEWNKLQDDLRRIKASEMLLRMKIYKHYFPAETTTEGTNNVDLAAGWLLKAKRTIDRKVDLPVLQAFATKPSADLPSKLEQVAINLDNIIEWEPKLKLRAYRALTPEQLVVFDQVLTIKDGAPGLEIVLPASAKPKAA